MSRGILIAAPSSGAGKTTITLGLMAALKAKGVSVSSAKSGPDYIDGRFHEAATGKPCINLDAWAMSSDRLRQLAPGDDLLVVEGAMGLFDGAPPDGQGSAADLATALDIPIILVVDAARQSQSIAALVHGFSSLRASPKIAGVILNRVGSERHKMMLTKALQKIDIAVIGAIPSRKDLARPSRHLGLVQAREQVDIADFIETARDLIAENVDLEAVQRIATPTAQKTNAKRLPPPAQYIAIARDDAFDFLYPHFVQDWRIQGAELSFFSPLADEAPARDHFVFLPGGYPELHAGKLAANQTFMTGVQKAPKVYGECGGYMVMGDGLIDADGHRHQMAGLLRLETSFETRTRHLGYRQLTPQGGPWEIPLNGHEFHYATTLKAKGDPLFYVKDAEGQNLDPGGLINGANCGSFMHVIDAAHSEA
ncbi:MAG: cobyrinate a,c-diamide synthase [Pseudomonadota bacterium]